jgi:hypothetical protein
MDRRGAPIRVAQSALGPRTPHRDLFLSQYHCLYLDGVLIPVVDLLNYSSITRCSAEDLREIEYFHIKLVLTVTLKNVDDHELWSIDIEPSSQHLIERGDLARFNP